MSKVSIHHMQFSQTKNKQKFSGKLNFTGKGGKLPLQYVVSGGGTKAIAPLKI